MALPAGRKGVLPSELTPEGKIKNSGSSYVLPTASAETLGGVKVGSGLSIDDGVLSVTGGTFPSTVTEVSTLGNGSYDYTATANGFLILSGYVSSACRLVIEDNTDTNARVWVSSYVESSNDHCGVCMPMINGHTYKCYAVTGTSTGPQGNIHVKTIS